MNAVDTRQQITETSNFGNKVKKSEITNRLKLPQSKKTVLLDSKI